MRLVWVLLLVLAGTLTGYLITRFEQSAPVIQTRVSPVFIGSEHSHEIQIDDQGTGLEHVRVWVRKGDRDHELLNETFPGSLFTGATLKIQRRTDVTIRPKDLGLPDGPAVMHIEARDYSWSGNQSEVHVPIVIDTRAPRISLKTGLTYVRRGGSEMAVYEVDEIAVAHGIQVGSNRFPGFKHPAESKRNLALYAIDPENRPDQAPEVFAEDRAGNRSAVRLPIELIERSFPKDQINLSDSFMELKVTELLGSTDGDVLNAYLKINNEMRAENAKTIREICQKSSSDRLWRGAFKQLPNSHVGARFAEHRTYYAEGRSVDTQLHLGYDLASTAHAPIPAANDGVVVFADRLGIYGTTVILDHGLGLFSLYGHLSELTVEKGQAIAAGEVLGKTGTTGLAGGDHLHFGIMVAGVFVDPIEWFDEKWIREHIDPKLIAAVAQSP